MYHNDAYSSHSSLPVSWEDEYLANENDLMTMYHNGAYSSHSSLPISWEDAYLANENYLREMRHEIEELKRLVQLQQTMQTPTQPIPPPPQMTHQPFETTLPPPAHSPLEVVIPPQPPPIQTPAHPIPPPSQMTHPPLEVVIPPQPPPIQTPANPIPPPPQMTHPPLEVVIPPPQPLPPKNPTEVVQVQETKPKDLNLPKLVVLTGSVVDPKSLDILEIEAPITMNTNPECLDPLEKDVLLEQDMDSKSSYLLKHGGFVCELVLSNHEKTTCQQPPGVFNHIGERDSVNYLFESYYRSGCELPSKQHGSLPLVCEPTHLGRPPESSSKDSQDLRTNPRQEVENDADGFKAQSTFTYLMAQAQIQASSTT